MQPRIDSVTLTILQQKLDGITREMGVVMSRTARSTIASQAHDFSCFITDARGQMISQAEGIPIHTGGGGFAVRAVLAYWGKDIYPGDIFVSNDVYWASGNHLADWTVFSPIFSEGSLTAFACIRSHQMDIGGGAPGTYNPQAREIFQEGLRLPPVKLEDRGAPRRDVWDLLQINSRCPEILAGDLRAMVGSVKIGAELVGGVCVQFGRKAVESYWGALLDHAERMMRRELEKIPDGSYEATETMSNDCHSDRPVKIHLRLTVKGSDLTADFTGTDRQIEGYKNSPLANTYSAVYVGVVTVVDPQIPHNEGTYRMIQVVAPRGSVVNPEEPAPVAFSTIHPAHEIIHCCWKALAQAVPERVSAGWGKMANPTLSGRDRNGRLYVLFNLGGLASAGAVRGRDGIDQIGTPINLGGMIIPNLESLERLYPVQFLKHELRQDSAGAGEYRGGTGVEYEVRLLEKATLCLRGEGQGTASGFGIAKGAAGREARVSFQAEGQAEADLPAYGILEAGAGVLRVHSSGSGGWGDPFRRDLRAIGRDIQGGLLSPERAREDYGVILAPETGEIDEEKTRAWREGLRGARNLETLTSR